MPACRNCCALLRAEKRQFLLYCDDLSFDKDDTSYKSLKAALEGGIEGRPENVLFYATSNRRHLMPRDLVDNERGTAINPGEAVEEKVSLSDRFGLWLGFHNCGQDEYLAMVEGYAAHYKLKLGKDELRKQALAWAMGRGNRSGRVAWQFIQEIARRIRAKSFSPRRSAATSSEPGLSGVVSWRISKCNCGVETSPVRPA